METSCHHIIFDIETESCENPQWIRELTPDYPEFDESAVKTGDCKTEERRFAKIEVARQQHAEQEEAYWREKIDRAALTPEIGRVVTIGYLAAEAPDEEAILDDADFDEARLLRRWWAVYDRTLRNRGKLIGWNSDGFDVPYLVKRSWMLGVPVPSTVWKGRWLNDVFLDLMKLWGCHEFRKFAKLDVASKCLGFEQGKTGQECTGAEFAKWYRDPSRHEQAVSYGKLDLTLTRAIYLRLCPHYAPSAHMV
jgi:hypothetical protein